MTVATIEVENGSPVGAVRDLLRSLLERGLLRAILVPQETPSGKTVVQTLVRDPEKLPTANPLAPVFGVNSARTIAKMCAGLMRGPAAGQAAAQGQDAEQAPAEQVEPDAEDPTSEQNGEEAAEDEQSDADAQTSDDAAIPDPTPTEADDEAPQAPIGVVLRPCETRAFIELIKLQQANLDPFLIIGVDCWGTYSVQDYAAKVSNGSEGSTVTADFLKQVTNGDLPEDLRGACRGCQHPTATCADLSIQLIGEDISHRIGLQANTDRGRDILAALELEDTPENGERQGALDALTDAKKKLAEADQIDFLDVVSSLCINCRNCRAVCPICYCKQCVFDGQVFEYPMDKYLDWSGKRGVLSMPPDKLLFHLTRMSHVATSCVACGQCEAACPSGIPLGRIYQRISAAAQDALGYEAGRSLDEELPLTTFREDELSVVEN